MSTVFNRPTMQPVTVCGRTLPHSTHICVFFENEQEEYDILAPFFAEGLRQGEMVVSIRDAAELPEHKRALQERMPDTYQDSITHEQLRIFDAESTYLFGGYFGQERSGLMVSDLLKSAQREMFRGVRTCGDMNWALRGMPGTDELMQYEARVNYFTREHACTMMCRYDLNRFSGRAVLDVLATHQMVVMGGRIYENPYYVEPTEYLQTLARRGSAPLGRED